MKLAGIHLNNFKSYKGLNKVESLDKNLSTAQNIVLFGGLNGAGKTTFLEALFLCFYGKTAANLYPSRGAKNENYEAFIISCLNDDVKALGVIQAQMSIEIFLKDVRFISNFPKNISIRRTWEISLGRDQKNIKEQLYLIEDGQLVQDLPESEFQDKIMSILPYPVAQFFFFDGEKIQDFAADADNEFAKSLKDVLGITIYAELGEDLKKVREKILRDYNKDKTINENLLERRADKSKLESKVYQNGIEINHLQDEINVLEIEKEKIDQQTFRYTRISADNRDAYHIAKEQKEIEKEILQRDYFDTAKDYLPFILAGEICDELEVQLEQESKYMDFVKTQKAVEPQIETITNQILEMEPQCPQRLTPQQKKFYRFKIDAVMRQFLLKSQPIDIEDIEIIHGLSEGDQRKIADMLKTYNKDIVSMLQRKAEKLKHIELDLNKIRQTEARSGGSDEAILQLFQQKDDISKKIGEKRGRIAFLNHEMLECERKMTELEKQLTNLESKVKLHEKQRKQMDYCEKMIRTIESFKKKFQTQRTTELENSIMEMWNLLAQKDDLINRITIYPERNFDVKLFDKQDREKDKTKFSAGEKEIYAISLLWALVQVSGKQIPIVIDTPFGRLDSLHRNNLAKFYFPKASHQVLLFSQDEEIVDDYYEALKPSIANEFSIAYNPITRQSEITSGYKFAKL